MAGKEKKIREIYQRLFARFGKQFWWPGETPFEISVGAILTQNTNWGNVERAIANLKNASVLSASGLKSISHRGLAELIRPSGYFNIKAKRLRNFIDFLFREYSGSLRTMAREPLPRLRPRLLAVNGIGPETADSILLYALNKPIFVVDAYTRRFLSRHGLIKADAPYDDIQAFFMRQLKPDVRRYNEYHALIVRLGKEFCRPKPDCAACPLFELLGAPAKTTF